MFQNFSGKARRPRQVNLSGQNLDPFASTSWAPEASGTKKTVIAAQQERLQRQQERERLNSAKRIQRVWRGHRVRKSLADSQRASWDDIVSKPSVEGLWPPSILVELVRLLVSFFSPRKPEDVTRLNTLARSLLKQTLCMPDLHTNLKRFTQPFMKLLVDVLSTVPVDRATATQIGLLSWLASRERPGVGIIGRYFEVLSKLQKGNKSPVILDAIAAPLEQRISSGASCCLTEAHRALLFTVLTSPSLSETGDDLSKLAEKVDVDALSQVVLQDNSISRLSSMDPEKRLWILSYFVYFHKNTNDLDANETSYIKALSTMLSLSANDVYGRIEVSEQKTTQDLDEDEEGIKSRPLPDFVRAQIVSLVDKDSITGLLAKFDTDYVPNQTADGEGSLLSSYALTLLRTFPTLGEEIRMWLYQSSVLVSDYKQVPALKLFWKIMKNATIFAAITHDGGSAHDILRTTMRKVTSANRTHQHLSQDRDWQAILLFLELYAFALRFTDDEEFLSGGQPEVHDPSAYMSRSRESSLPLDDVRMLTVFLKNLCFTMYYNAAALQPTGEAHNEHSGGLSSLFGSSDTKRSFLGPSETTGHERNHQENVPDDYFGIAGMTFDYVRKISTRVMQMLYERDSRRRFLPRDHWLMTSRFDMQGFIPAVVAEEERRRQVLEEGADEGGEADEGEPMLPVQTIGRGSRGMMHAQAYSTRDQRTRAAAKTASIIGPRLEILQHMPYAIPFKTRVQIFRQFAHQDQVRRRLGSADPDIWRLRLHQMDHGDIFTRHHARIQRNSVAEDAFKQFYPLGEGLKEPIQITFVDQFGNVEAGIDGGGVTKEFLTSAINEIFDSTPKPHIDSHAGPLFVANDQNLLYPNPAALDTVKRLLYDEGWREGEHFWNEQVSKALKMTEFSGRIIGKCLYEGILVDIGFAGFFLLKWASSTMAGSGSESRYQANINDLRDLDEGLYQGLLRLKNYSGNVEDFDLNFTIDDIVSRPGAPVQTITRELMPSGANTPVTNENRVLYISLVARHRLHTQPLPQTRAFLRGLWDIISPSWLSMFNQIELQTLVGGDLSEIDVDDLRRNTEYSGVYVIGDDGLEHPTIQLFWQVMKEFNDLDRRKVLKYVTSTPRAPLLGFGALNPKFSIRDSSDNEDRLPTASTCINLLKLPRYKTKQVLRDKLLYAVSAEAGFDLS